VGDIFSLFWGYLFLDNISSIVEKRKD